MCSLQFYCGSHLLVFVAFVHTQCQKLLITLFNNIFVVKLSSRNTNPALWQYADIKLSVYRVLGLSPGGLTGFFFLIFFYCKLYKYFWNHSAILALLSHEYTVFWAQVRLTFVSVPNSQYSEDEGTEGSSKETSPIVPHSKERGCYFNTEQHAWKTHTHTHNQVRTKAWLTHD